MDNGHEIMNGGCVVHVGQIGKAEDIGFSAALFTNTMAAVAADVDTTAHILQPTVTHVNNCQFQTWFNFPGAKKCTFRSIVIPIPENVVKYLHEDGVILPVVPEGVSLHPHDPRFVKEKEQDDSDWDDYGVEDAEDEELTKKWCFPEFERKVQAGIEKLGGKVFVKTNWSAPRDAVWVSGTLECRSFGEIFTLLKSSDFVSFDLEHAYDECSAEGGRSPNVQPESLVLVLRKWCNLHPAQEFRCFVKDRQLIGTSQRDPTQFYEFLPSMTASTYNTLVSTFFENTVKGMFPEKHFCFDIYIDRKHRVWLVDFNVFGAATDALLFCWKELVDVETVRRNEVTGDEEVCLVANDFRVLESEGGVKSTSLTMHKVPTDVVNNPTSFLEQFVESWRKGEFNHEDSGGEEGPAI